LARSLAEQGLGQVCYSLRVPQTFIIGVAVPVFYPFYLSEVFMRQLRAIRESIGMTVVAFTLTLATGCTNVTVQVTSSPASTLEITLTSGSNVQITGPNISTSGPTAEPSIYGYYLSPFNVSGVWLVSVANQALPASFNLKVTKSKLYQGELVTDRFITEFNCDFDGISLSYATSTSLDQIKPVEIGKIPFNNTPLTCLAIVYASSNLVRPLLVQPISFNGGK
jgi:hypothetical protein